MPDETLVIWGGEFGASQAGNRPRAAYGAVPPIV